MLISYKDTQYYDQKLILDLLNTDFKKITNELFEICLFYSIQPNRLDYFDWSDRRRFSYKDYITGNMVLSSGFVNFDCFQYTWFILQKLAVYGIIKSPIDKYIPYYLSIETYKLAITNRYLIPMNIDSYLTSGFMFYLNSTDGWERKGCRHTCFYVTKGDSVFVFENLVRKGTSWKALSIQEFKDLYLNKPECYISSNTVV
jgi:hypothetical protein